MKHIKKYNEAVDTNAAQEKVFLSGCANGWNVAVEKLLNHQNFSYEILKTGLLQAVKGNNLDIAKFLIQEKNVDPTQPYPEENFPSLLSIAVNYNHHKIIDYLLDFENFDVNEDNALLFKRLIGRLNISSNMNEQEKCQQLIIKAFQHPTASPMKIVHGFYTDKDSSFNYLPYLQDFEPKIMNAIRMQDKFDLF
jgi:hypothetical protein